MFDWAVLSALIGSLFFYVPTRLDGDELFSFYALVFVSVLSLFCPKKRTLNFSHYFVLLFWVFVTTLIIFNVPQRQNIINIFVAVLAIKVIAEHTTLTFKRMAYPIAILAVINYQLCIFQILHIEPIYGTVYTEVAGSFLMPWTMGCFAVLAIPFIYLESPFACFVLLPLLIWSKSWTCLLAGAIVFAAMLPNRKLIFSVGGFLLLCALVYLFFFGHDIDSARFKVWAQSFKYLGNDWIGNGLGSWAHEGFIKKNGLDTYHWRWAHNEIYQWFFETGWVGLCLLMTWLGTLLIRARGVVFPVLLAVLSLSMVHPVFHYPRLTFFMVVILALIEVEHGTRQSQDSELSPT